MFRGLMRLSIPALLVMTALGCATPDATTDRSGSLGEAEPRRESPPQMVRIGEVTVYPPQRRVEVNAQYLERRDDNPFFVSDPGDDYETLGGLLEVHYFPQGQDGRWVLSGLYNYVDSNDDAAKAETLSLTLSHLLARNLRLVLDAGRDTEYKKTRASLGLVAAF